MFSLASRSKRIFVSLKKPSSKPSTAKKVFKQRQYSRAYRSEFFSSTSWVGSSKSINYSASQKINWLPFLSAPLAYAAFWSSSSNDNTLEKVNEDVEKLGYELSKPTQETADLAESVLKKVCNLPNSELRRDPMYIMAVADVIAKTVTSIGPFSNQSLETVIEISKLMGRIIADSQQEPEIRLNAQKVANMAEYHLYTARYDLDGMKKILLRDLELTQSTKTSNEQSMDESQVIWLIAAVEGSLEDPEASKRLSQSIEIFKGVTKETLTPELERFWIERIVSCLSHALTLEVSERTKTAPTFKNIALALYEQYKRVAPEGAEIPEWKELEARCKTSVLAKGPQ